MTTRAAAATSEFESDHSCQKYQRINAACSSDNASHVDDARESDEAIRTETAVEVRSGNILILHQFLLYFMIAVTLSVCLRNVNSLDS